MRKRKHTHDSGSSLCHVLFAFLLFIFPMGLYSAIAQAHCRTDIDCPLGLICREGFCDHFICNQDKAGADCPNAGNACIRISCENSDPTGDLNTSYCVEDRIEGAACVFDRECGSQGVCNTKTCQCESTPPPLSLCAGVDCDDHDPCTTDSCNEDSGLCHHSKIDNCPAPTPPENPMSEAIPTVNPVNPCIATFSAQGVDGELANTLAAQGICSLSLTGQSARACSLVDAPDGSPWPTLLPLFGGIGLIFSRRGRGMRSI